MRQLLGPRGCRRIASLVAGAVVALAATVLAHPADAGVGGRAAPESAVATTIAPAEWQLYRSRFIHRGRVVDVEKNGVSHSEGQGYGMLLAVRADDRETFDALLIFTFDNMRARSDGLVSWVWNPHTSPHVTDANNASDGDILIAYALVTAAAKWNDARYIALAEPMIDAIGRSLLERRDGVLRLRPAAFGFDDSDPGGPVVNLSYYVYGALLLFAAVDDDHPWLEAWQSGLLLTAAATSPDGFVPDWVSMDADAYLMPARGWPPRSSYDAVRIPLYMALGGRVPAEYFAAFDTAWNVNGRRAPKEFDIGLRRNLMDMNEPGYRAIAAVAACAARGVPLPPDVATFRVQRYFASSLHLLALSAVRANYPGCVSGEPVVADAGAVWSFAANNGR